MKNLLMGAILLHTSLFCSMEKIERDLWLKTKILNYESRDLKEDSPQYLINVGRIAGLLDCLEMFEIERKLKEEKEEK